MSLSDQFPSLFFDVKEVEVKTPRPLPSMTTVMTAVLSKYGINTPALAMDLASAAEEMFSMRTSVANKTSTP